MPNRPLMQADPTSWNRSDTQRLNYDPDYIYPDEVAHPFGQLAEPTLPAPPQRKSVYRQSLDACLGKSGVSACFLHEDNFEPEPRWYPAPMHKLTPSAGVQRRLVTDAKLRAERPDLVALLTRDDRQDYFARLRRLLGKPISGQQSAPPAAAAVMPAAVITSDAGRAAPDAGLGDYFARLGRRLGKG
jgi:hypothetical protein